jgi:hypothetical protein|tara:strand:- start:8 stop:505 length:498 start_codon:yes stop_codon:yes gene_type:complete
MKKTAIAMLLCIAPIAAYAEDVQISGNVQTRCLIVTDTNGVFGNPVPSKLSTASVDGGVVPVVRYDVTLADSYLAKITTPTSFSSSPSLADSVSWSGSTTVTKTTDAGMAIYETNKATYGSTTEFDLTIAGSTWFSSSASADYGYNKSFPGGIYSAVIVAECIAK